MCHKLSRIILALFLINQAHAHVVEPHTVPSMPTAKPQVKEGEIYVPADRKPEMWVRDEDEEDQCEHGEDE